VNAPLVRPRGAPFEPLTGDLFRMHLTGVPGLNRRP
jgi:hypothetical protein